MKMRITIEVERVGADLTDDDLSKAASNVAGCIEATDVKMPYVGSVNINRASLRWAYTVEEVR